MIINEKSQIHSIIVYRGGGAFYEIDKVMPVAMPQSLLKRYRKLMYEAT